MSTPPQIITITDAASGAAAKVLVSLGFNCFSWQPQLSDGPREMLWAHAEFAGGNERPSGSGIPLLFPFPGRIGGAKYSFGGREYQLEPGDAFGNAIHGFVHKRPWRIVEQSPSRVVGEFQASVDDASILECWPSDFKIQVSYEVRGRELASDVHFENTGDGPLPCGFGTHTYFRLPLADGANMADTLVYAPVSKIWKLQDMLATGQLLSISPETDLSGGPIGGRNFDTSYTGLAVESDGWHHTWIREPKSGRTVTQLFDRQFTQCIVYIPPHREAICLEPYTCVPDSFRLTAEGHATGLRVLAPGESFKTTIPIAVSG
ncbi:MAG: aldose 1-epimerase [Pirellulales bacterium]